MNSPDRTLAQAMEDLDQLCRAAIQHGARKYYVLDRSRDAANRIQDRIEREALRRLKDKSRKRYLPPKATDPDR